jgi:hypothetical protein
LIEPVQGATCHDLLRISLLATNAGDACCALLSRT